MSPTFFYDMTVKEGTLLIERYRKRIEEQYSLNFVACYNAFGAIQGGKKFKINHPFQEEEKQKKKATKEDKEDALAFIKKRIEGGEK